MMICLLSHSFGTNTRQTFFIFFLLKQPNTLVSSPLPSLSLQTCFDGQLPSPQSGCMYPRCPWSVSGPVYAYVSILYCYHEMRLYVLLYFACRCIAIRHKCCRFPGFKVQPTERLPMKCKAVYACCLRPCSSVMSAAHCFHWQWGEFLIHI